MVHFSPTSPRPKWHLDQLGKVKLGLGMWADVGDSDFWAGSGVKGANVPQLSFV